MSEQPVSSLRSPAFTTAAALAALGLVATRFIDLARQSPWNDEVCNWMWAQEWPAGATPPQQLTYATLKTALALGDNVYCLRLPGALMMSAIGLLLMAFLWRNARPLVAGVFAAVWVLSPMAIFYSQDANHYAFVALAGAAALVGTWRWWAGDGWRRVVEVAALGALCAAMKWAHPMAVFPLAGLAVAVVVHALSRPRALPLLGKANELAVRGVIGGFLIVGIAIAVTLAQAQAQGANQGRLAGAVYFTLWPEFQGRLLASAFGAYMHSAPMDYLTGLAGLAAAVVGWLSLARRHAGAAGAVVGMVASYAALAAFMLSFDFSHSFHVRFAIFLLPGLLVGWAAAVASVVEFAMLVRGGARDEITPGLRAAAIVGLVAATTFALSWARWASAYYGGEFQPARRAMAWIAQNTEPGTIVGTRSQFLAQSFAFLNARLPQDQQRDYRYLGERPPTSYNAVMLARRLAVDRPVVLLDMASIDEAINVEYNRFTTSLPTLAEFPSSVPRDFFDFDRSLIVRAVTPDGAYGTVPVSGANAHQLFPVDGGVHSRPSDEAGRAAVALFLKTGTTATTFIKPPADHAPGAEVPLTLSVQVVAPAEATPWLVVTAGGLPVAHLARPNTGTAAVIDVPVELPFGAAPGGIDVAVTFAGDAFAPKNPDSPVFAVPMVWQDAQSSRAAPPIESWTLAGTQAERYAFDQAAFARAPLIVPPLSYTANIAVNQLGDVSGADHPRLLVYRVETTGLSSGVIVPEWSWVDAGGQPHTVRLAGGTATATTFGPVTHFAVIPPGWKGTACEARVRMLRTFTQGPHGGGFRAGVIGLYDLTPVQP